MKIGIIVAMSSEYELVRALMSGGTETTIVGMHFVQGNVGSHTIILAKSGIGKVCSALGAVEMINRYRPDYIINSGVAGGIDVRTRVMDIIVGEEMVYHDVWCGDGNEYGQVQGLPSRYRSDENLYRTALELKTDINMYGGLICSGDSFITDRTTLDAIKKRFPEGLAVDMESASIAQTCYIYGVPFLSLRIISDTPGVKDHAQQYNDFWTTAPEKSFEVLKQLLLKL